ncbi:MAG: hypothetical protein C0412_12360 [Flavobacterium sp.]|nr:hypothetical protein [Flavobacterium sp.]
MKKYFVSLCVKIPANFEVEVSAKNETEAFGKAEEMFDGYDEKCISEPLWGDIELDIGDGSINKLGNGIYIEEIVWEQK